MVFKQRVQNLKLLNIFFNYYIFNIYDIQIEAVLFVWEDNVVKFRPLLQETTSWNNTDCKLNFRDETRF